MLWRLAFPALTLIVGFMAGIGVGNVILSGENDALYAQFLAARDTQQQYEAEVQFVRQAMRDQAVQFEETRDQLVSVKIDQDRKLGQADAIIFGVREQLTSCESNMSVALSTVDSLLAELDSSQQNCSIPSQ